MGSAYYLISFVLIGIVTYDIVTTLIHPTIDTDNPDTSSRTKRAAVVSSITTRQSRREEGVVLFTLTEDIPRRTSKALKLKKQFYAAILSTSDDATNAVVETWAQRSADVVYFRHAGKSPRMASANSGRAGQMGERMVKLHGHHNSNLSDSAFPLILAHICKHGTSVSGFYWYMLATDAVYVDVTALKSLLSTKSASNPVVLGHKSNGRQCSIQTGIIFNDHTLTAMCAVMKNDSATNGQTTNHYIENVLRMLNINCVNFLDDTSTPGSRHVRNKQNPSTPLQRVNSAVECYARHLAVTVRTIDDTRRTLARMRKELTLPANAESSGQNELANQMFGEMRKHGRTMTSFRQFINQTGYASVNSHQKIQTPMASIDTYYKTAKQQAERMVRFDQSKTRQFAFKTTKWNVGTDYKFYFINSTHQKSGHNSGEVTLAQVNIANHFDSLSIHGKHVMNEINVTIVTSIDERSAKFLATFLQTTQRACSGTFVGGLNQCKLLLVVFSNKIVKQITALTQTIGNSLRVEFVIIAARVSGISHVISQVAKRRSKMATVAYIPMHVQFNNEFLLRCHLNVNSQTYFPIANQNTSSSAGYWNTFETFCARANDIAHAYYRDRNTINKSDYPVRALYEYFGRVEGTKPLRIPDIGLVSIVDHNNRHHLHDKKCRSELQPVSL